MNDTVKQFLSLYVAISAMVRGSSATPSGVMVQYADGHTETAEAWLERADQKQAQMAALVTEEVGAVRAAKGLN